MRAFHDRFGTAPSVVYSAPGRVNLIGEHTDYNDGFVLPFALPLRTTVAARPARSPQWTVWSSSTGETAVLREEDLEPGRVAGWAGYIAGVLWVLREAGHAVTPADLAITSEVPLGAGLSSSAALECAVLAALVDLGGLSIDRSAWPALGQRAENAYVGVPCGIMDQTAVTLCQAGHALFLDCRSRAVEHIPFRLAGSGLAMLVVDTRAPHRHVCGEYADRRRTCEEAAAALGLASLRDLDAAALPSAVARLDPRSARRVRHVVTENQRVLDTVERLRSGETRGIGPLLTQSHASMRDDFEITVPEVDTAVEAALDAGAYGARMTGGGFGGCVLALVDAERLETVADAVLSAFAQAGFAEPAWFAATAEAGVVRVSGVSDVDISAAG